MMMLFVASGYNF